jgi:hypothetical protein
VVLKPTVKRKAAESGEAFPKQEEKQLEKKISASAKRFSRIFHPRITFSLSNP